MKMYRYKRIIGCLLMIVAMLILEYFDVSVVKAEAFPVNEAYQYRYERKVRSPKILHVDFQGTSTNAVSTGKSGQYEIDFTGMSKIQVSVGTTHTKWCEHGKEFDYRQEMYMFVDNVRYDFDRYTWKNEEGLSGIKKVTFFMDFINGTICPICYRCVDGYSNNDYILYYGGPIFQKNLSNMTALKGENCTFLVESNQAVGYEWYVSYDNGGSFTLLSEGEHTPAGSEFSGTTSNVLTLSNVQYEDALLQVKCEAVDSYGVYSVSDIAGLNVVDGKGPEVSVDYSPKDKTEGSVTIMVSATDSDSGLHEEAYSYDGGKSFSKSNTYEVNANGTYVVVVRDALGNCSNKSITIDNIFAKSQVIPTKVPTASPPKKDNSNDDVKDNTDKVKADSKKDAKDESKEDTTKASKSESYSTISSEKESTQTEDTVIKKVTDSIDGVEQSSSLDATGDSSSSSDNKGDSSLKKGLSKKATSTADSDLKTKATSSDKLKATGKESSSYTGDKKYKTVTKDGVVYLVDEDDKKTIQEEIKTTEEKKDEIKESTEYELEDFYKEGEIAEGIGDSVENKSKFAGPLMIAVIIIAAVILLMLLLVVFVFGVIVEGECEDKDEVFDFCFLRLVFRKDNKWAVNIGSAFDDNAVLRLRFGLLFAKIFDDWDIVGYSSGINEGIVLEHVQKNLYMYRKKVRAR